MAAPTITSVSPSTGHSGGKVLVEITGSNFQLPTLTGQMPEPDRNPDVRVLFDGEEATDVAVWSTTQLFCRTPELDPGTVETVFTADNATDTFTAAAHGLRDDQMIDVAAAAGGALPTPLEADTPYYVVNATTDTWQLSATEDGPVIDIADDGTGVLTATSDRAVDVVVENIEQDGTTIQGETATRVNSFIPVRPNLSTPSHLAVVMRTFIQKLERQITPNVSWTTHEDYDEDRDTIDIGFLSSLPGLLLTSIRLPKTSEHEQKSHSVVNYNDPVRDGDFAVLRPPDVRDIVGNIIGVSNNDIELLNLGQVLCGFFKKNPRIAVPRDPDDSTQGTIEYKLRSSLEEMTISPRGGVGNVQWFSEDFKIIGVRLEDIPGLPARTVPGVPTTLPCEAITGVGKTAETIDVETTPVTLTGDGFDGGFNGGFE